jgi:hypothetical protein
VTTVQTSSFLVAQVPRSFRAVYAGAQRQSRFTGVSFAFRKSHCCCGARGDTTAWKLAKASHWGLSHRGLSAAVPRRITGILPKSRLRKCTEICIVPGFTCPFAGWADARDARGFHPASPIDSQPQIARPIWFIEQFFALWARLFASDTTGPYWRRIDLSHRNPIGGRNAVHTSLFAVWELAG